ncbi:homoserine dehydrogenase [uncultured Hymenobacter sp.]|uniref:homoserine dehydrogenase n=1 Tax=uncultured Hymenobacter sp. TaxID=170016 RepID=UPI0035CB4FC6
MSADKRPLRVGLIGFGCVGQGFYDIVQQLPAAAIDVARIVVKSPSKPRSLPPSRFEFDADALLADPSLDVLIEVIDDAAEAFRLVSGALRQGRRVVTANKAMLARHLPALRELERTHGGALLYEAAVAGSIPILRTLDGYFGAEPLRAVSGIINGSSNYVLTRMAEDGSDYAQALAEAQARGFAETDPTLDMAAFDPRSKAVLLAAHAFGLALNPDEILNLGIENITPRDLAHAEVRGLKIKVVAHLERLADGRVGAVVLPRFVGPSSPLFTVEHETNGVLIEAAFGGPQFLRGKGAGGHPTGSAVLADVAALRAGYRYGYAKTPSESDSAPALATDLELEVYLRHEDEHLPRQLGLRDLSAEQRGAGRRFSVGYVRLDALRERRDELRAAGAFVAATGASRVAAVQREALAPSLAL